jgi:transcription elongation factor GreA
VTASIDAPRRTAALTARVAALRAERDAALAELVVDNSGDTADRATNMDANARFAVLDQRIAAIEAQLSAPVRRVEPDAGVSEGAVVTVDLGDGPETFLFGSIEQAGDDFDVISPGSPLGAAIAGARVGDTVEYRMRNRTLSATVVAIS